LEPCLKGLEDGMIDGVRASAIICRWRHRAVYQDVTPEGHAGEILADIPE